MPDRSTGAVERAGRRPSGRGDPSYAPRLSGAISVGCAPWEYSCGQRRWGSDVSQTWGSAKVWAVSIGQRYRLRTPSTGRETILEAEPETVYVDRDTGEAMEVTGKLLPLAPSPSRLPWAVENLRFCSWCDQLVPKDLNDCPHCGRRMAPLAEG